MTNDKICKIIDKHINNYEEKFKSLILSGKDSDKYTSESYNSKNAIIALKKELIKENLCENYENAYSFRRPHKKTRSF